MDEIRERARRESRARRPEPFDEDEPTAGAQQRGPTPDRVRGCGERPSDVADHDRIDALGCELGRGRITAPEGDGDARVGGLA